MDAARSVAELFEPYCNSVEVDAHGNVLARSDSGKNKTILLDAHLDQIGFIITEVLDDGFLRFAPVGGVDPRMLLGNELKIFVGGQEPVYGVISCMPPHLLKPNDRDNTVPIEKMLIDTGLIDAKERIPIGSYAAFAQPPVKLLGDRLSSKCLDDRAGVAALLMAMERLSTEKKLNCNIAALISTQEEATGLGAQSGTFKIQPDYAIAVDVTHGKTPDGPSEGVFELGSGAAIGMGPNFHRPLTRALIKTAKANDIKYSLEVMEGNTGTNAWTIQIVACGVATALISIPVRYMHTPVETVSLSDIEAAANLIYHFIRGFNGEVEQ